MEYRKGKSYVAKNGAKVTILDIWINAVGLTPEAFVKYRYSYKGRKGVEKNPMSIFVEMMRTKEEI